jgi:hypothetical protein
MLDIQLTMIVYIDIHLSSSVYAGFAIMNNMDEDFIETREFGGTDYVHIGCGVYVMSPVTFKETIDGAKVEVDAEYDPQIRRIVAKKVKIDATDDRPELSSSLMQKIKIQNFLRTLLRQAAVIPSEIDGVRSPISLSPIDAEYAEHIRAEGPTDSTLKVVARYYRLAEAINEPPTKAVQECLQIPRPTAANWVSRARSAGLLES